MTSDVSGEMELRSPFRTEHAELWRFDPRPAQHPSDEDTYFGEQDAWGEDEAGLPYDDEDAWEDENDDEVSGLDLPEDVGAPFAPQPPAGASFPVRSSNRRAGEVAYRTTGGRSLGSASRRFGASRDSGKRRHAGIDLYADFGDEVVACQPGTILKFYPFCCAEEKTTSALVVDHHDLVINYGEVAPDSLKRLALAPGSAVTAGQVIAFIGRNPRGSSMLHFEAYAAGTRQNLRWPAGTRPPKGLLDPTRYLLALSPTPPASTSSGTTTEVLRRGSRGPRVRQLQDTLNRAGFTVAVDGIFGPATDAMVRAYQRSHNLAVDGVVGPQTWAALSAVHESSSALGTTESYHPLASEADLDSQSWTNTFDGGESRALERDGGQESLAGWPTEALDEFADMDEAEWARGADEGQAAWEDEIPFQAEQLVQPADEHADRATEGEAPSATPLLTRGQRGAAVARAQTLLNRFLATISHGPGQCVDGTPARVDDMRRRLLAMRRKRQLPLVVDGRFGANTEHATHVFQSCRGLVRDGKIGPVTWHYLHRQGSARPSNPPDTAGCGVPDRPSGEFEEALDIERELLNDDTQRRAAAVQARLSLFQNASLTSHRNHFQCQASRVARLLSAYADPRADRCSPRRVGPTPYDTGADIINAISAAHMCMRQRLTTVHIFGHSGSNGVYGTTGGSVGLYISANAADRATGARSIVDIPLTALANEVVVVLHGCNQAEGSGSFAEELHRHLVTRLSSPTVFAHPNSGCAGRDNSWRRFDSRSPAGRRVPSIVPHYSGDGCCSPSRGEAEVAEWESEDQLLQEWQLESSSAQRRPCNCGN